MTLLSEKADRHFLAWNGLSFFVPCGYDPVVLDKGYMQVADSTARAFMELRWQQVQGRFAGKRFLRKLWKQCVSGGFLREQVFQWRIFGKRILSPAPSFFPEAFSPAFAHALKEMEKKEKVQTLPFFWQHNTKQARQKQRQDTPEQGFGAVVYHEQTHTALCLQFFCMQEKTQGPCPAQERALRVLETVRFCAADPVIPWSVFDIRAQLPARFSLESFHLLPGHFRLCFQAKKSGKRSRLMLDRLAPGNVILADTELYCWAQEFYKDSALSLLPALPAACESPDMLVYTQEQSSTLSARTLRRLFQRPEVLQARIHYNRQHNKIHSMILSGTRGDMNEMTALWEDFSLAVV